MFDMSKLRRKKFLNLSGVRTLQKQKKKLHEDPESHHREKLFGDERQNDRSQESRNAQWSERRDTEAEPQGRP